MAWVVRVGLVLEYLRNRVVRWMLEIMSWDGCVSREINRDRGEGKARAPLSEYLYREVGLNVRSSLHGSIGGDERLTGISIMPRE